MKNRCRSPTIKQITKLNYNRKEKTKYDCKGTI